MPAMNAHDSRWPVRRAANRPRRRGRRRAAPARRGVLTGGCRARGRRLRRPAFADDDLRPPRQGPSAHRVRLTVLGTTDLHGNVFNWDYFKNKEYDDTAHNDIGLAKVATLVKAVRKKRRGEPVLMLDAGDTIQGTPLAYYYAKIDPITDGGDPPDGARR